MAASSSAVELDRNRVAGLVRRAAAGDGDAWAWLIDRYSRLIWSITAEFRLVESDAADVAQTTWMRLIENIDRLKTPEYVGAWLAATARNECLRSLAVRKRMVLMNSDFVLDGVADHEAAIDEGLLASESAQVVREALTRLPQRWRQLMELLMSDPPTPYAEISEKLGLSVGSIGPTRGRCLDRLRVLLQAPEGSAAG